MRPALEGHAGIPQEARLLFLGLSSLGDVQLDGLIQHAGRVLAPGLDQAHVAPGDRGTADRFDQLSRVVISLQNTPGTLLPEFIRRRLQLAREAVATIARMTFGVKQPLGHFDARHFRDFIWRTLFARTLGAGEFERVTDARYRVVALPWNGLHGVGILTRAITGRARFPRLATGDYDILIGETPYPARVARGTRMVVRYHDAVPILMPHTIINTAHHQAIHYNALRSNVRSGAWFSCVSEATRRDLLSIFPEVESRAVTIPNMVSPFYRFEPSAPEGVVETFRTRLHTGVKQRGLDGKKKAAAGLPRYLLMVSTLEPRKNHLTLLSAWERMRAQGDTSLKFVLVGSLGWGNKELLRRMRPWLERGDAVMLENVPADELRQLYHHATVTVCPSLFEGFDFSGVEAMRCGSVVISSDIPVHREVFGEGSDYFDPYSSEDMGDAIARLIAPDMQARREALQRAGKVVGERYLPERIIPEWHRFLREVMESR